MIYLDNSATTYPKPEVVYETLDQFNRNCSFNAGRGSYKASKKAFELIDKARESIAKFVDSNKESVTFLSSATEALNLIIAGIDIKEGDCVFITPFEHNAIIRPLYNLKDYINFEIIMLPFDRKTWMPNLKEIENIFSFKKPKAVFVSHISNVTGLIIDYKPIFELSKKYNSVNVLDCAQSFGVINPSLGNIDFCVFAGHKSLYGSFGVGGFISRTTSFLKVIKAGGNGSDSLNHKMPLSGHERIESGSPNTPAIASLITSCNWLRNNDVKKHETELTIYLINELKTVEHIVLYLPDNIENLFGIVSFNVRSYSADDVASILSDEFDIAVRSGFHCSPFVHNFIGSEQYGGTVRVSLGAFNTKEDIDKLIIALKSL